MEGQGGGGTQTQHSTVVGSHTTHAHKCAHTEGWGLVPNSHETAYEANHQAQEIDGIIHIVIEQHLVMQRWPNTQTKTNRSCD